MTLADACLIVGFGCLVGGCGLLFGVGWALIIGGLILMGIGRAAYRSSQ